MTYRVVQWATGAMGTACLREIIDDPRLDLVGVYVYDTAKVGADAGTIARRPETGVRATDSVAEILGLGADVVVHAARLGPYGSHDADLVALLESGANVITINGYSDPLLRADARSAALQDAAILGHVSLMAAGLNPGFIGEQLAVVVSGLTSRLDHLEITEYVDSRAVRSPDYLFGVLGFGADPAVVDPNDPQWGPASALNGMYEEVVGAVAERLGIDLDRIETDHRVYPAPHDLRLVAGTITAGAVSHTNWCWHGVVDGTPILTVSIHWYADPTHLPRADPPLWEITLTGHPGVRVSVDLDKHPDDTTKMTAEQYALAAEVVNTIPVVYAAEPGVHLRPVVTPFQARTRD